MTPDIPQRDLWIAGVSRGHNSCVCLLKNGEVVFAIEEERLTRRKYDGAPLAALNMIFDYTKKLDYLVLVHTQGLEVGGHLEFTGEDVYTGWARKMGLIDDSAQWSQDGHPQIIEISDRHHKMHAACAFYRSGFEDAVALIADGAGSMLPYHDQMRGQRSVWEYETIMECSYPAIFKTRYKHVGCADPIFPRWDPKVDGEFCGEPGNEISIMNDDRGGITKTYEAVTQYLGWQPIEAGKTMGLFPYGIENGTLPPFFDEWSKMPGSFNRNVFMPNTPNGAFVNTGFYEQFQTSEEEMEAAKGDFTKLQVGRDVAFKVQKETQREMIKLIKHAVEMTGKTNVVISGGYALNCVANYEYLDALKEEGITIYVEPVSSDAGTAIGGALFQHYALTNEDTIRDYGKTLYLGPEYNIDHKKVQDVLPENGVVVDTDDDEVVELLTQKNIVCVWQGRSENGPRALGNRSILFDPTFADGKDYVNAIKRREYFRPFAGSILEEDVHDWFDLRGMERSSHMMYAVNCQPGIEEKIPSIIHIDGSCRIQTVNKEENPLYHQLISKFKEKTGVPIVFNTSFNLGGEPLVETLEDAIRTLENSDLEYLYLPELKLMINIPNANEDASGEIL
ncbi:MAG: hypothetical protein CBB96_05645 [Gammaproteobacteria bacterium TMED36]|nr:MAG: hypothetical protein CBB96_08835 [Gammaproteobacteria bacterium TMED36]OUT94672.1 MAG: hypothetical protein CBB96_05645 [Gammaproteobacteria bacterium TMED36]